MFFELQGEVLHVHGIMATQGNLVLSIDGSFARLENRELLLRFGNVFQVVCRQLGLDFVDVIANRYPSDAPDLASGLGLGGGLGDC